MSRRNRVSSIFMDDIRRGLGYYKLASSEAASVRVNVSGSCPSKNGSPLDTRQVDRVRYGAHLVFLRRGK